MTAQHVALQELGAEHDALERFETKHLEPAQRRRPATALRTCIDVLGQTAPVQSRSGVMLDVVAVIEKGEVVQSAVVTDGAAHVFEVSLQETKAETGEPADQPGAEK